MLRITVGILPDDSRTFLENPYEPIPGANVIYYPEVSEDTLDRLLKAKPQDIDTILSSTANI